MYAFCIIPSYAPLYNFCISQLASQQARLRESQPSKQSTWGASRSASEPASQPASQVATQPARQPSQPGSQQTSQRAKLLSASQQASEPASQPAGQPARQPPFFFCCYGRWARACSRHGRYLCSFSHKMASAHKTTNAKKHGREKIQTQKNRRWKDWAQEGSVTGLGRGRMYLIY